MHIYSIESKFFQINYLIILLGFSILLLFSCQEKANYSDYKNGVFELYKKDKLIFKIEREGNFQMEIEPDTGVVHSYSEVIWVNDSSFKLNVIDKKSSKGSLLVEFVNVSDKAATIKVYYPNDVLDIPSYYKLIKVDSPYSSAFTSLKKVINGS